MPQPKSYYQILFIICSFVFPTLNIHAQHSIEIGGKGNLSFSYFITGNELIDYQPILTVNPKLGANFKKDNFLFQTGIGHLKYGAKFTAESYNHNDPQFKRSSIIFIETKIIASSLSSNYIFINENNLEVYGGIGIFLGYLYKQQMKNESNKDLNESSNVLYKENPRYVTELNVFNDLFFGVNSGLGLRWFPSDKIIVQIRPNYFMQVRKELPEDEFMWTNRITSFSVDLGIFYKIDENKGK